MANKTPNALTAASVATVNHTFAADTTPTASAGTTEKVTLGQVSTLEKTTIIPVTTLKGTYLAAPSASQAGRLYFPTNDAVVLRDTGAAWERWGTVWNFIAPDNSTFSWVNQGSSTVAQVGSTVKLIGQINSEAHLRVLSAPSTPYTLTAAMRVTGYRQNTYRFGILVRDSGTGKFSTVGVNWNAIGSANYWVWSDWGSTTTFAVQTGLECQLPEILWLRVRDNGTNLIWSYSVDGINFIVAFSSTRTFYMATPNQLGFWLTSGAGTLAASLTLLSWDVSADDITTLAEDTLVTQVGDNLVYQ